MNIEIGSYWYSTAHSKIFRVTGRADHFDPFRITVESLAGNMARAYVESAFGSTLLPLKDEDAGHIKTLEATGTVSEGVSIIARERTRQFTDEGYNRAHDDSHTNGELANAAAVYALTPEKRELHIKDYPVSYGEITDVIWPFEDEAYKPSHNRIKELAKAGGLIAAELDRFLRMSVYRVNECDWVLAHTLSEAKSWYQNEVGMSAEEAFNNPTELAEERLKSLTFTKENGQKVSFKQRLIEEVSRDTYNIPRLFGSTEY